MSNLRTLQNAAANLDREERVSAARRTLQGRIPRPFSRKAPHGRPDGFPSPFRARLTLARLWISRNAPAIRHLWSVAVSFGAALLVAYGVWTWNPGAGYVTAGFLIWVIQWNYGDDETETSPGTPLDGRVSPYGGR